MPWRGSRAVPGESRPVRAVPLRMRASRAALQPDRERMRGQEDPAAIPVLAGGAQETRDVPEPEGDGEAAREETAVPKRCLPV